MKQCVAPVSSRTVARHGPCAVQGILESCVLNVGLLRYHARNSGTLVSIATRAAKFRVLHGLGGVDLITACVADQL